MNRFALGIDLGTTHTVVAAADLQTGAILDVPIPQSVGAAEIAALPLLPSTIYVPASGEFEAPALDLPWGDSPSVVLGRLALAQGTKVPGRLIASAKSWLCVSGVDRRAAILPWAAEEGVARLSPVDVQTRILRHVRNAWLQEKRDQNEDATALEATITVPASFDEVARELTVEAARAAGFVDVRLLEEPQAAFYELLRENSGRLTELLRDVRLLLVVDVGGGTTDLTLVAVRPAAGAGQPPGLERIAVSEHLMLGGDNMDVTLARHVERDLTGTVGGLDAISFAQLVVSARLAKETLLALHAPDQIGITLVSRGKKLLAGARTSNQRRDVVEALLLDGFFPRTKGSDVVAGRSKSALSEFGLPYARDPAIPRHVATFLRRHISDAAGAGARIVDGLPRPDAILLNGGVFQSPRIRARFAEVLAGWYGDAVPFLDVEAATLDRAVARGAAYSALVRRGRGLRISGGSARSYYLGIDDDDGRKRALCVVPQGLAEGSSVEVPRTFRLVVGEPVSFPLYSATFSQGGTRARAGDLVDVVDVANTLESLPTLQTVIPPPQEIPVRIQATLTEVGTLELGLQMTSEALVRFGLSFSTRLDGVVEGEHTARPGQVPVADNLPKRVDEGKELILGFFGSKSKDVDPKRVKDLRRDLEKIFGVRETWSSGLLRELAAVLLSGATRRRRSAEHERVFFQLLGFCLRPGFGVPFDDWRIDQVWPLWKEGIQYIVERPTWGSWFVLWRRVAGGLTAERQRVLAEYVKPWLLEQGTGKKGTGPTPHGTDEMIRLVAALERISADDKVTFGDFIHKKLGRGGIASYWPLGRIGAREPLAGSAHDVVPAHVAARWAERILEADLKTAEGGSFALAQIARVTGDRTRDLDGGLRDKIAARLDKAAAPPHWVRMVQEKVDVSVDDDAAAFGESLPVGLRLHGG